MKYPEECRLGVVSASVVFVALHLCAAFLSNWVPDLFRPFSLLAATTLLWMTAAAWLNVQLGRSVIAILAAAVLSMTTIYLWRHSLDPAAALGTVPPAFERVALAVLGVTNVLLAVIVAAVFSGSRLLRYR